MERQDASTEKAATVPRMKMPDRSQIDPNPKRIDDLIPHDHPARLVWELVQGLDLTPLYGRSKPWKAMPDGLPSIRGSWWRVALRHGRRGRQSPRTGPAVL